MALVLTRPRRIAGFPKVKRAAQNGMRNLKTIFGLLGKGDRRELIYQFIDTSAADFPISTLCKVCQVSHSGYYRWDNEGRQVYEAACKTRETLKEHVLEAFEANRSIYGPQGSQRSSRAVESMFPWPPWVV